MKKTIALLIILGVIIGISGYLWMNKYAVLQKISDTYCTVKGGKIFLHSFSRSCEVEAKDAGKICTNDSECEKNQCVYPIPESCIRDITCDYPQDHATTGKCDKYLNDNDGVMQCHRPSKIPTGFDKQFEENKEGKIFCEYWIS